MPLLSCRMLLISWRCPIDPLWVLVISIWFRMACFWFLIERYWFPTDFLAISYWFSVFFDFVSNATDFVCDFYLISYGMLLFSYRMLWVCYWFPNDLLSIFCNYDFHLISYRMPLISYRMLLSSQCLPLLLVDDLQFPFIFVSNATHFLSNAADFIATSSWCLIDFL